MNDKELNDALNASKVIKSETFTYTIAPTREQILFVKQMTGMKNTQEALEHFAISCLEFFLLPDEVLSNIDAKISPLLDYNYGGNDE